MAQPIKRRRKVPTSVSPHLKPLFISGDLALLVNHPGPLIRTDITKKVWEYIKANGLQDKNNRRMINCDAKMYNVFGKHAITMFEMTRLIGNHIFPTP